MTLPASFFFWVFVPGRGVVKAVCEPTTCDPATAEVASTVLAEDDRRPMHAAYSKDVQRRLDEAASDALGVLCRMTCGGCAVEDAEAGAEKLSLVAAENAEHLHDLYRFTHPEDASAPCWHEHN